MDEIVATMSQGLRSFSVEKYQDTHSSKPLQADRTNRPASLVLASDTCKHPFIADSVAPNREWRYLVAFWQPPVPAS